MGDCCLATCDQYFRISYDKHVYIIHTQVFSLDEIWTHTIDTLQQQLRSLMSSALDHSATSVIH